MPKACIGKVYQLHMALMLSFLARIDVIKNLGASEYFDPMYVY